MAQKEKRNVKIILLGDSAVGKSKYRKTLADHLIPLRRLIERFLMDDYKPQQQSTFALTLFHYSAMIEGELVNIGTCKVRLNRCN